MKTLNVYKAFRLARLSNALDSCLCEQSTIIWLLAEVDEEEQLKKKPKKKNPQPLVPGFIGTSRVAA